MGIRDLRDPTKLTTKTAMTTSGERSQVRRLLAAADADAVAVGDA